MEFGQYEKYSLQNIAYNISFSFVCIEYFYGIFRLGQAGTLVWPMKTEEGGQDDDRALALVISLFAVMGTKSVVFFTHLTIFLGKGEVTNFINRLFRLRRAGKCGI